MNHGVYMDDDDEEEDEKKPRYKSNIKAILDWIGLDCAVFYVPSNTV